MPPCCACRIRQQQQSAEGPLCRRKSRNRVLVALGSTVLLLALTPSPPSLNRPVLSQPVRFSSLRMAGPSNRPPTGPATGPTRAAALRREPTDITKWAVSGTAALVIATRRDLASVLCVSGAVLNALLAKLLKRLLKEVCHPPDHHTRRHTLQKPTHHTPLLKRQPSRSG